MMPKVEEEEKKEDSEVEIVDANPVENAGGNDEKGAEIAMIPVPVGVTADSLPEVKAPEPVTADKASDILTRIKTLQTQLRQLSPQDDLLDHYNIWIIKPASMSRGRGISFFADLPSILKYVIGTRVEWIV